jgi:hypothetical protein
MIGFALGISRMISDFAFPQPKCGDADTRPGYVKLNFMYFALIMFVVTTLCIVVLSFFGDDPEPEKVRTPTLIGQFSPYTSADWSVFYVTQKDFPAKTFSSFKINLVYELSIKRAKMWNKRTANSIHCIHWIFLS